MTEVRETSRTAYEDMQRSGVVNRRQLDVWQALRHNGPMTGMEVDRVLTSVSAHKRLSELARMGIVAERRERPCSITGNLAIEWMAIDTPPISQRGTALVRPPIVVIVRALADIRAALQATPGDHSAAEQLLHWIDKKIVRTKGS